MGRYSFQIFSLSVPENGENPSWTLHVSGKIRVGESNSIPAPVDLNLLQSRCLEETSIASFYQKYRERGIDYGDSFQGVQQLQSNQKEVLGLIQLPEKNRF